MVASYKILIFSSLVVLVTLVGFASPASAQNRTKTSKQRATGVSKVAGLTKADTNIPAAALSTERGRKLVNELRMLRSSEASMGKKHPQLAEVKQQIVSVKRKLISMGNNDDVRAQAEIEQLAVKLNDMPDDDLRVLVSQLIRDVRYLRERVIRLEKEVSKAPR